MIEMKTLEVSTSARETLEDITAMIRKTLKKTGVESGRITLFVPHTTAAVTINENADPDVGRDLVYGLKKTFPDRKEFQHAEGNSDAHIKSSVIGPELTLLVENGDIVLGTWQGLYFCEFDGPRRRKLHMQIEGK